MPDETALNDLATFARIEVEANDMEPWAEVLRAVVQVGNLDVEDAHWLIKGYNAFDGLGSAFEMRRRWPTPAAWASATDRLSVIDLPCTQERRGLRGGKVGWHLDSYVGHLAGQPQDDWVRSAIGGLDPEMAFRVLTAHLRGIWGVGRQTAFEWAEFLAKVLGVPVAAPDAQLWESEGPRRSLQRIYGNDDPDPRWLDERAIECRAWLAEQGVPLSWEDFETIICDFNVMRDGRYYPGRHLAALKEEIAEVTHDADREMLEAAWELVVPPGWRDIPPGIDKTLLPAYRTFGVIAVPGCAA